MRWSDHEGTLPTNPMVKLGLWVSGILLPLALLSAWLIGPSNRADEALRIIAALGICLLGAELSLIAALWAFPRGPVPQLASILLGGAVRMALVLGLAGAFHLSGEPFNSFRFWIWIAIAYLVSLVVEVWILLETQSIALWPQSGRMAVAMPTGAERKVSG